MAGGGAAFGDARRCCGHVDGKAALEQKVLRAAAMTGGATAQQRRSCVSAANSYELLPWRAAELHGSMQQAMRQ